MEPMTVEQLGEARRAVLRNARSLHADAELLLAHGRHARAFALGILACEECGKIPALAQATDRLITKREVNWKKLDKNLRSHRSKLAVAVVVDDASLGRELRDGPMPEVRRMDMAKQKAFYVFFENAASRCPDDAINEEAARTVVEGVGGLIHIFETTEAISLGDAAVDNERRALKHFARVLGEFTLMDDGGDK